MVDNGFHDNGPYDSHECVSTDCATIISWSWVKQRSMARAENWTKDIENHRQQAKAKPQFFSAVVVRLHVQRSKNSKRNGRVPVLDNHNVWIRESPFHAHAYVYTDVPLGQYPVPWWTSQKWPLFFVDGWYWSMPMCAYVYKMHIFSYLAIESRGIFGCELRQKTCSFQDLYSRNDWTARIFIELQQFTICTYVLLLIILSICWFTFFYGYACGQNHLGLISGIARPRAWHDGSAAGWASASAAEPSFGRPSEAPVRHHGQPWLINDGWSWLIDDDRWWLIHENSWLMTENKRSMMAD